MKIGIHPLIYYRSKSEEWQDGWKQDDWTALNLVRSIKHKPIPNASRIKLKSGGFLSIDSSDGSRKNVLSIICNSLAGRIEKAGYDAALIVPIPSSDHTAAAATFTGSRISDGIQKANRKFTSSPVIYFSEVLPKSSEGGGRDAALIQSKLRGGDDIPAGSTIILVDDVYTTGAHMKAVTRYLRSKGMVVNDGFVVARTRWERPKNMLKGESEEVVF